MWNDKCNKCSRNEIHVPNESVQKQKYSQRQGSIEICENFAHANKSWNTNKVLETVF